MATGNEVGSVGTYGSVFAFSPDGQSIAIADSQMRRLRFVRCATADELTKDVEERRSRRERQEEEIETINTLLKALRSGATPGGRPSAEDTRTAETALRTIKQSPEYHRAYAPRILSRLAASLAGGAGETERDSDHAEELLAEVERLTPNDEQTWHLIGDAHKRLGNWTASKEAQEKALEADLWPATATLNSLAWLLATCPQTELRDPDRAVDLARRADELRPDQAGIRNTLGVALYRQGEWQEAIDTLKKNVSEGTKSVGRAADHIFIAMSYWQLGNQEEARKWYNDALELIEERDLSDNEEDRRFRTEAESLLK